MNVRFHRLFRAALCSCALLTVASAAEIPSGFVEEKLADGIDAATTMCVAPDGRVFFAGQFGALRVWKDGRGLRAEDLVQALELPLRRSAQEPIVPDSHESLGQHVQTPAAQELLHAQRDDVPAPGPAVLAVEADVARCIAARQAWQFSRSGLPCFAAPDKLGFSFNTHRGHLCAV
jgi:hypothetical protein